MPALLYGLLNPLRDFECGLSVNNTGLQRAGQNAYRKRAVTPVAVDNDILLAFSLGFIVVPELRAEVPLQLLRHARSKFRGRDYRIV